MKNKNEVLKSKVKMHDAGQKMEPLCLPTKRDDKYYPNIMLDVKNAPFLEGMNVGDNCRIVCDVVVTSRSMDKRENGNDRDNYTLKIKKIGKQY